MTYFESAEGEVITRSRALQELRKHGITDFNEFYAEMGERGYYSAQAVLLWLGY